MYRFDIINQFIKELGYKRYLEIGVQNGVCFNNVKCDYKIGVDPSEYSKATVFKTSDDFFRDNIEMFDIIFLDGLHEADQVYKDIINALEFLNQEGTIIVHDCNPQTVESQTVPRMQAVWNGDVWKTWVILRAERSDLEMCVLNTDHGCGIIKKGYQEPLIINEELTYENFDKNRIEWLNLVNEVQLKYEL